MRRLPLNPQLLEQLWQRLPESGPIQANFSLVHREQELIKQLETSLRYHKEELVKAMRDVHVMMVREWSQNEIANAMDEVGL